MYEHQVLVNSNASFTSIPSALAQPKPFSPPTYAIWVNILLFLSLVISLTCAMLATLLQQWARRYIRVTRPPRYSPHDRARIRAFFSHGVEKFQLSKAVDALPSLIQLSLFLFFAGLLLYLLNINYTVFCAVAWSVGFSAAIYMLITIMPIFWHESPCYTPLSSLAWTLYIKVSYFISLLFCCIRCYYNVTFERFAELSRHYRDRVFQHIEKIGEENIQEQASEIDGRVMKWTFDTLIDDNELGLFFQCILGFHKSRPDVVKDPQGIIQRLGNSQLSSSVVAFLHRTLSSNFVPEPDKIRRLVICVKVADATRLLDAIWHILDGVLDDDELGMLDSVETGHFLRSPGASSGQETNLCAKSIVGCIIANAQNRDHRWIALAASQLGKSEDVICAYLEHGDSVLLANLIHITRQFYRIHDIIADRRIVQPTWQLQARVISHFTRSLSKFDVQNTLPGLQHDFCALWNELVQKAGIREPNGIAIHTLIGFRRFYLALHQDAAPTKFSASTTDDDVILRRASSYPLCDLPGHRSEISVTGQAVRALIATQPTTSHDATLPIHLPVPNSAPTSSHHAEESLFSGVFGASRSAIPIVASSHPVSSENVAGGSSMSGVIDTSTMANPIPVPTREDSVTPQYNEGATIVYPGVPNSLSSPPLVPGHAHIGDLHSPADTTVRPSDSLPHGPGSSSTTASSHVTLMVPSVPGSGDTATIASLGTPGDAEDTNDPTRPELPRCSHQSEPPAPNTGITALQSQNSGSSENSP
jgi:Family of unknown function (DUF6535)